MEKIIHFSLFSAFCSLNVVQFVLNDAAEPWQIGFQDPASPVMQGLIDLHHDIFSFMVFILLFVVWMLGRTIYKFNAKRNPIPSTTTHNTVVEVLWTAIPIVILVVLVSTAARRVRMRLGLRLRVV